MNRHPAGRGLDLTRRSVLKRGLAGILAYGIAPRFLPASLFGRTAPSNRVTLGMIGNGLICNEHVGSLTARDDCRILALSDVWRRKAEAMRKRIAQKYEVDPGDLDIHARFEELLARDDIDAVFVCTPDHWHAAVAKAAMVAGKDVYCEKPLTLTVREGRVLVETARRCGRVLQTGTQQRSNKSFRKAAELVRNGAIGEIKTIRTRLGHFPPAPALPEEPVPPDLDYDRWLGPTPWRPFNENRIRGNYGGGWRCFLEYGGRKNGDWGAHHFDIIQWALGMDASGPVEYIPAGYEGTKFQTHVYADGTRVIREDGNQEAMIEFHGSKGFIGVSRGDYLKTEPATLGSRPLSPEAVHLYASEDHENDFLHCVRTRQRPLCDVEVGHRTATVCHLNGIAAQLRRPIRWDPVREEIVGDSVASRLLDRPRRTPYAL